MNCNPANPKDSGIVDVWQESIPVRFGAIDKSDRLTLDAIFNYFQEAAISHADNLGIGREDMARTKQVWILSRMTVLVHRRPDYCENIIVRSWPQGREKLFAMRNYEIRDKENEALVSARSAWLIVDMEKRRPLRPQSVMDNMPQNEGINSLTPEDKGAAAITERDNLQKIAEKKALYSDLDFNGHVNNVSYIKWIEDIIDAELLNNAEKMRVDINYLNEIMGGEEIELFSARIDDESASNSFAFEGRKKGNNQAAFRAELKIWLK